MSERAQEFLFQWFSAHVKNCPRLEAGRVRSACNKMPSRCDACWHSPIRHDIRRVTGGNSPRPDPCRNAGSE